MNCSKCAQLVNIICVQPATTLKRRSSQKLKLKAIYESISIVGDASLPSAHFLDNYQFTFCKVRGFTAPLARVVIETVGKRQEATAI